MFIINIPFLLNTFVMTFFIYKFCQANFCNSHICDETTRAFCKFELSNSPASHCFDYEKTIKTSRDKQDILDKINSRRNKIASGDIRSLPSAENVAKMEWSVELEISAQWWANQCVPYSELDSIDICSDLEKDNIGQNIATVIGDSPGLTPAILVDVWYMELLNVNASLISRYRPSNQRSLLHYDYFTQLAWAESNVVGCGSVRFKDLTDTRQNRTINRLVCNFSPGGNLVEERVYNEGSPCSRCPNGGMCDLKYPSLCNSGPTAKDKKKLKEYGIKFNNIYQNVSFNMHVLNFNKNKTSNSEINIDKHFVNTASRSFLMEPGDENATTFDYLAHLFSSTSNTEKVTYNLNTCKDVMPVEDFIDIFKKRLIKDQVLKHFLLTSKMSENKENSESSYTDATVAELMSHVYSTKEVSTTTKSSEPDYINSTLLVNLVEAVIFKNNDKSSTGDKGEQSTNFVSDVSAIRIKPELGEIQTNLHSTGHYFFPEDDNEQQGIKEMTDSYYDISSVPVSDIVLEIQELKRNKGTKDFLDEILESDFEADNTTDSNIPSTKMLNSNRNGSSDKVFLINPESILFKKPKSRSKRSDYESNTERNLEKSDRIKKYSSFKIKKSDLSVHLIDYQDLLRKIALDLNSLKLNDRFHCTGTLSNASYDKSSSFYLIFLFILHFFHL